MLYLNCNFCGAELVQASALLFSPPSGTNGQNTVKFHICKKCFDDRVMNVFKLEKKITELQTELDQIKEGIKRIDCVMIVDGNDMYDWGWTSLPDQNKELSKRGLYPFNCISNNVRCYDHNGKLVYKSPELRTKIHYGNPV